MVTDNNYGTLKTHLSCGKNKSIKYECL